MPVMLIISGCSDSSYQNGKVSEPGAQIPAGSSESKPIEYIIALVENADIEDAIRHLHKYDAQVIKDLKRGRYLISIRQDPGIEQLKEDIDDSEYIERIQPNFTYTAQ